MKSIALYTYIHLHNFNYYWPSHKPNILQEIFLDIANLNSTPVCISAAPGSAQWVQEEEMMEGRDEVGNLTNSYGICVNLTFVVKGAQGKVNKII